MENKDDNEFFEDICNIARVLPNLTASTIHSELNILKNDPDRVKLILRKYFASYEPEEHNCMSDDIKKIKRVLPDYPFIHINNDLLAVEHKENRIQLVLKKYFDNQVKATKRSLLLDTGDPADLNPGKKLKLNEHATGSRTDINSKQISNTVEKEQSSNETETESYTTEFQPTIEQSNQVVDSNNVQDENFNTASETIGKEEIVPFDTNDQNLNVLEEINDNAYKKTPEITANSKEQKDNNETAKTSLLSVLSDLFPQHSTDVFKVTCDDFGIDLYGASDAGAIDLVVNSLINYCSTEEYDAEEDLQITNVYSIPVCDRQISATSCVETSQAGSTEEFTVGDFEHFFRNTVENSVLNLNDKAESGMTEQTCLINKELVQTDNLTPQNVVKDVPNLFFDPEPDQNTVLNELQNFLCGIPELKSEISKLCPNQKASQFDNKPIHSICVPSTNISELSTVDKYKSTINVVENNKNSDALNFENGAIVDFNTEISHLYTNSETSQLTEPTTYTSAFDNNSVSSTDNPNSPSPDDAINRIIKTFSSISNKKVTKLNKKSDTLNFESALLNNVFPELNMSSSSGTSRTAKPGLAAQSNNLIKPASFHPKPSTSRSSAGNFPRSSSSIIKPATFQLKSNKTTSSGTYCHSRSAAGIYTTANTKAITSSVSSTSTKLNRNSSSKSGLNSESLTTKNSNLRKIALSKSNPDISSMKSDIASKKLKEINNSHTVSKTSTKTFVKIHIIKPNNVKTHLTGLETPTSRTSVKSNILSKTKGCSKTIDEVNVAKAVTNSIPNTSSKSNSNITSVKSNILSKTKGCSKTIDEVNVAKAVTNSIPSTSSKSNSNITSVKSNILSKTKGCSKTIDEVNVAKAVTNPIPSTSSKSNSNITKQLTKPSTEVRDIICSGSSTNCIPDSSSKRFISIYKTVTLANAITRNKKNIDACTNFVQGLKKEFPKNNNNPLPSTSGTTCSFASKKQDINKNTLRVRTDLYDAYFNGPVLQTSEISKETMKPRNTKKREENDDIIFVSAGHLPFTLTKDSLPATNSIPANDSAPITKIQRIEEKLVFPINDDISQPSTSKTNVNHPFYFKLLEIFPDVCPDYLKKLCSESTETQNLDDLVSVLLSDDYKRRNRPASPETNLDFEEQHKILQDLFPDADPTYLQHHCERLIDQPDNFKQFVASIIENKNYPTKAEYLKKMKLSAQEKQYTTEFDVKKFLEVIPNPEEFFQDPKRQVSFSNFDDTNYAVTFLKNTFCTTAIKDITSVFKKNNYSILRSAIILENIHNMKTKRKPYTVTSCKNIPLLQEIAYVKHKKEILEYIKEQELEKKLEREHARTAGLMKTCQCCYDDEVMPDDTKTCESGLHIFCNDCVRKGCEVLIGDGKLDFPCLETCDSFFTLPILQAVLSPKVFSKMAQRQQMAEVKSAGIEDLEFCPFCDFAAIPPPGDKLFRCLNSDCMKESCRLCKEPSHIPLRCDEVEKDKDVKMRTYIEDKMTEALLRKCWKCGMKFIKESGCNKMTCSCGALMCYVCNQPVQDYKHFNGQGGDQTHLCPLYSDTHKLHVDAIKRGAESAKKELGVDKENQLKIDPTVDLEQHYRRLAAQDPAVPNIPVILPQNIFPR